MLRQITNKQPDLNLPKVDKLLTWTDFGPDKYLDDKGLSSMAKSLGNLQVRVDLVFGFVSV